MTSQINPNNIDGNYPVPGVPNNTQGFRSNFTETKTNFQYAAQEITALQNSGVFKAALPGTTLDNNMNDNLLYAVKLQDVSYTYLPVAATSGSITIDYSAAPFQQITTTGSVSLAFTNWPATGSAGTVRVAVNITNTAYTLTLPTTVTQGLSGVQGISPGTSGVTNTITFGSIGNYAFEFATIDGGTNVWMFDDSRPADRFFSTVTIENDTVSTSPTTGALIVDGGVGISGNLNVAGNVSTFTSSTGNVYFTANSTGQISLFSPSNPANTAGAFNIVGSSDGTFQAVTQAGGMLHITGNDGVTSRITNDSFGTGAIPTYISRAARGTAASPTVIQANDVLGRFAYAGWTGNIFGHTTGGPLPTSIDIVATENYTGTAVGSMIQLYTAPTGTTTRTLSANITASVSSFPSILSTGNIIGGGNILITDGGAVGYTTGAGGTVTQTGNKSTGVTLNKVTGEITMASTNLAADTAVSFTLTNSTIGARDMLLINLVGGGTPGAYFYGANCTTGSAVITVRNLTAGTLGEALVLRYAVIRGSIA